MPTGLNLGFPPDVNLPFGAMKQSGEEIILPRLL